MNSNILSRRVFVLNRNYCLINETTVEETLKQMAGGAATALDIPEKNVYIPTSWEDWLKLPPLAEFPDEVIHTSKLAVRMPTVVVLCAYNKIPKRNPKFTLKNIARRDGYRCQHTGDLLDPKDWSLDHVDPLSRGGADAPENVVLCGKEFNNKKGNKTCEELGIKRPKIKKLGIFAPVPSHIHHTYFLI